MFSNDLRERDARNERSVYQRVLGDDFASLDPQLQRYFGVIPVAHEGVGIGLYDTAGLRCSALAPLFELLARRQIAFPERGVDVPFTVHNLPGRSGVLRAARTFFFRTRTRVMRDAMHVRGSRLVDRIGKRGELEVELALSVSDGGLQMESRALALRVGPVRIPLPPLVRVTLVERSEGPNDAAQHVDLRLMAPLLGEIYGFSGTFTYAVRPVVSQ